MLLSTSFLLLSLNSAFSQATVQQNIPQNVEVSKKKNPGDLPYAAFHKLQERLISYLPPEPRVIDFLSRASFHGVDKQASDDFSPTGWGVAIVGESVDHVVPMIRGGYFVLPNLPQAKQERAKILFNTKTKKNFLKTAWKLRLQNNSISYQDFAKSFGEVKQLQEKIRWYEISFQDEKDSRFDSLKACFMGSEGEILIDDKPANTTKLGRCVSLVFDPSQVASNPLIQFKGEVEMITLANSKE